MASKPTQAKMGLWSAVSLGIGGMIGAGIFSILGVAASLAGGAVYLAFLLAGGVALLCAYSYAHLGQTFPSAGGPVEFLLKGFGDGYLSGGFNILLWLGYIFVLALYAKAFAGYALTFFASDGGPWVNNGMATLIILLFTGVNFIGVKAVGRSELIIVAFKTGILVLFAGVGLFFIQPDKLSFSAWPKVDNILFAAGILFVAYEGFGLITNAAEDLKNPQKNLPRALYLSVFIVIGIYLAVSLTVIGNLTVEKIIQAKEYALAAAARPFLGQIGFRIMAIAALFSTASAINATLYGGANISYMMARVGQLPRELERKIWGKRPEGLFITAAVVILEVNLLDLEKVALLGSATFLCLYTAVNFAHLRLIKETQAKRGLIWLAIGLSLACLGLLFSYEWSRSPLTLVVLILTLVVSFALEFLGRKLLKRGLKPRISG